MKLKTVALVGAVLLPLAFARAEDTSAMLMRADQAFAAADYQTALSLYQTIEPKIGNSDQLAGVKERMRFATKQLSGPAPATQPVLPDSNAATREKHVRPTDGKPLNITLHELGNFDYDENDDKSIPADVKNLSGCTVIIPGVMLPLDQAGKVTRFMLVNDMMSCCYGTAPKLQHVIYVELPKDKWIAATTDRIQIEGTLKVNVRREDGYVLSIFEMQPTSVKFAGQ